MQVAEPSINEVFGEFLAEEQRRVAPRTFRRYEEVIGLLRDCLDGYAYESLPATERAFWEERYETDEAAGSYCNTFGPEKIPLPGLATEPARAFAQNRLWSVALRAGQPPFEKRRSRASRSQAA